MILANTNVVALATVRTGNGLGTVAVVAADFVRDITHAMRPYFGKRHRDPSKPESLSERCLRSGSLRQWCGERLGRLQPVLLPVPLQPVGIPAVCVARTQG